MKNWILAPALALALALTGCTGGSSAASNDTKPSTDTTKPAAGQLKVALLTPSPISDAGWSAMAYDGLTGVKEKYGAEISNQEATGTQIKDAMRSYAQKGYDLIIGHGYEYNAPEAEIAKDFPKVKFVSSSGGAFGENYGAFRFYLEQGFFLAGYMAAEMSKTGKLAMIGGPDVPSIRSTFKAFKAGAMSANPKVQVFEVFTGSGDDIAKAKQATLAKIADGADFVIHQANAAAQGVFDACKEKNVWAFGANADQNDNASGAVIASAVIVAKPAFIELAKEVKEGSFKGSVLLMGMKDNAIDFVINPKLKDKVPTDVQKKIADFAEKIKSGQFQVPKDNF